MDDRFDIGGEMTAGTIATIIILAILIFGVIPVFCLGWILYSVLLVRTKPEKWARECSMPEDEEYLRMFKIGEEWNEKYESYKRDVSITSCGLRLCGEYFDFGFNKITEYLFEQRKNVQKNMGEK